MAKLAEADERVAEAVVFYKKVVQEFPLSPFASEAALRVKELAPEEAEDSSTPEKRDDGEVPKKSSETLPVQDEGGKK
jgi:hypothetical protein